MKVEVEQNERTKEEVKSSVLQEEGQWDSEGNLGFGPLLATSGPGSYRDQPAAEV
jgi:hypothetical protein